MKIVSIVGARPQFIKASVVSNKLREKGINEILLHTGQHYDFNMSRVFFKELNLPMPDYYLGIGSGTHGEQTGKMLIEIEKVLMKEKPDIVLVYGDTNSTLAGALAVVKLHIPVAHVEAGLRSFNRTMPEEINRILTDHISNYLFAPTNNAVHNLKNEGVIENVYNVGDVMLDVALDVVKRVNIASVLNGYDLKLKDFILVTIHRAENTDNKDNLKNIWEALIELAKTGITIFFPVHPRTKKALTINHFLDRNIPNNLIIFEPVSYFDMVALENAARVIITDSGGIQKEGYFFKTPCIIPRNETEWIELVEIGWNKVVGNNKENIVKETINLYSKGLGNKQWVDFYGGGKASERITNILIKRDKILHEYLL